MPKATVDFSKQQFRLPPGPKPTLAGLREAGPWWMAYCNGNAMRPCHHGQPVTLAWALIRWGPEASSDVLRQNLRCSKCGGRGVTIMHPGHHSDRSFKGPGMMPYDDAVRPAQVLGEWGVLGSDRPLRGGER